MLLQLSHWTNYGTFLCPPEHLHQLSMRTLTIYSYYIVTCKGFHYLSKDKNNVKYTTHSLMEGHLYYIVFFSSGEGVISTYYYYLSRDIWFLRIDILWWSRDGCCNVEAVSSQKRERDIWNFCIYIGWQLPRYHLLTRKKKHLTQKIERLIIMTSSFFFSKDAFYIIISLINFYGKLFFLSYFLRNTFPTTTYFLSFNKAILLWKGPFFVFPSLIDENDSFTTIPFKTRKRYFKLG